VDKLVARVRVIRAVERKRREQTFVVRLHTPARRGSAVARDAAGTAACCQRALPQAQRTSARLADYDTRRARGFALPQQRC
jgi:hypothetical protein